MKIKKKSFLFNFCSCEFDMEFPLFKLHSHRVLETRGDMASFFYILSSLPSPFGSSNDLGKRVLEA